jgi:hypothetical protein
VKHKPETSLGRFWDVQFTSPIPTNNPSFPGTTYRANHHAGVIAETIEGAIRATMGKYPEAIIYSVNSRGQIHIADDGRGGDDAGG